MELIEYIANETLQSTIRTNLRLSTGSTKWNRVITDVKSPVWNVVGDAVWMNLWDEVDEFE